MGTFAVFEIAQMAENPAGFVGSTRVGVGAQNIEKQNHINIKGIVDYVRVRPAGQYGLPGAVSI